MIILKIGGSILTNKDATKSEIDEKNLSRIANEIKSSLDNESKEIIIVHGAGSFGHPPAKEYKIGELFLTKKNILKKRIACKILRNGSDGHHSSQQLCEMDGRSENGSDGSF